MARVPIVLLPGMMCDRRLWSAQIAALEAEGHPVLVPDISGAQSIHEIARQVLAQTPERFALAGLSMGGIVAFELWRQASGRITHLALLDTNAREELPERRALRGPQIEAVASGRLREVMIEEMKPRYLAERHRADRLLLDLVLDMALALGPDAFRRQSIALRDRPDSVATLATIDCPTLVLCGREDTLCPIEYHLAMAERIRGADLVVLGDCGHLSPLEAPEAVIFELRRLLRRVHSGAVCPPAASRAR